MPLNGPAEVVEGMPAHFECRVIPVGDPDLKIQWFVNGVALKPGKMLIQRIKFSSKNKKNY